MTYIEELEQKIMEAEREISSLRKKVEEFRTTKDWPDTLQEMRSISYYWGYEAEKGQLRLMLVINGPSAGFLVDTEGSYYDPKSIVPLLKGEREGRFIKFHNGKSLLEWMLRAY